LISPHSAFELLTLSQSWPQTSCWDINNKWNEGNAECTNCKLPQAGNNWTVHGLWPTNRYGIHPEFCGVGRTEGSHGFYSGLQALLSNKWPGLNPYYRYNNFWKYQYKKHGTCASDVERVNSLKKYFLTAIELLDEYNVGKFFEDAGIFPGNTYKFQQISNAIKNNIGTSTFVKCIYEPVSIISWII
jgi:ribonuclease T2